MGVPRLLVVLSAVLLAACADSSGGLSDKTEIGEENIHFQRMIVVERPPIIAIQRLDEMPLAIRAAERTDPAALFRRQDARRVAADALPYLSRSAVGRRFLAAAPSRALARGMPPEFCPAVAVGSAPPEAGRGAAAETALKECLGQLDPAEEGCGCRVMALDDVLTVPREEAVYASGISARLRVPGLRIDRVLVADALPGGEVLLRDPAGPVARLTRGAGNAVTVTLTEPERRFEGHSLPVGFRRGRLAERVYASDSDGNRLSLLTGFEPDELAGHAAAWLAWPDRG